MEYKDYYQILGVEKNADEKTIKKAYRTLARQVHPDVNPGDSAAEQRFKEINEAYAVLSDPEKRKKYDRFGAQWQQYDRAGVSAEDFARYGGFGGFGRNNGQSQQRTVSPEEFEQMFGGAGNGGFSDFFETLFGGGVQTRRTARPTGTPFEGFRAQSAPPVETTVQITLEEAFSGARRTLQRENGERIEADIPPGVRTGSKIRMSGLAGQGRDLYLVVEVLPHERFRRKGDDLTTTVDIDLYTAVLGGEVEVPTLERSVVLTIPAGTQNGKQFRLRKLGMPNLRNSQKRGDVYAEVNVVLPTDLSRREKELFEELRTLAK